MLRDDDGVWFWLFGCADLSDAAAVEAHPPGRRATTEAGRMRVWLEGSDRILIDLDGVPLLSPGDVLADTE